MRRGRSVKERVGQAIDGSGPSPSPRLFLDVIDAYVHSTLTFDVALPGGESLRFRHVTGGVDELKGLQRLAGDFADAVLHGKALEHFAPYTGAGRQTLVWCHMLGSLSAASEQVGAGDVLGFLAFQKGNAVAFEFVREQVQAQMSGLIDWLERRAIDEAKKKSTETQLGATA